MSSVFARQPGKAFWTLNTILSCFICIPLTCLYFVPKGIRPHPEWTFRQAVGNELLRIWFAYASTVEFQSPLPLKSRDRRFITMKPSTRDLYRGVADGSETRIQAIVIGGLWFPRVYHPIDDKGKKVILHFRGGGYVLGGCHSSEVGFAGRVLHQATSATVLFPQYRLASAPGNTFPAALQDALTSYAYLLGLGISPANIIISGDSAGAHLAVTMLRYLSENNTDLPNPLAVLLWSPWVNLEMDGKDVRRNRNKNTDFVLPEFVDWAVRSFIPPTMDVNHPYVSPCRHPFFTKTPL